MRLKKSFSFFRGGVKRAYKIYFQLVQALIEILLKNKFLDKYSFSKLFIYYYYLLYISFFLQKEFKKLNRARLNRKGPFYSILKFKQKPLRCINFFVRKLGFSIFKEESRKTLSLKQNNNNNLLKFYYYYFNPNEETD